MKTRLFTAVITFLFILSSLVITGCFQKPQPEKMEEEKQPLFTEAKEEEEEVKEDVEEEDDEFPSDYVGEWLRKATYVDGMLVHTVPAMLVMDETSYTSTNDCSAAGDVIYHGENSFTLTVKSSNCPGPNSPIRYKYNMFYDKEAEYEVMELWDMEAGPTVYEVYYRQG